MDEISHLLLVTFTGVHCKGGLIFFFTDKFRSSGRMEGLADPLGVLSSLTRDVNVSIEFTDLGETNLVTLLALVD